MVSSFAHPDYQRFDEMGYLNDIVSYPYDGSTPVNTDDTPPIRRRDTMNTIAHLKEARVIGGYRVTDGKPALYSSASSDAVGASRAAPSALLPGEDGVARFGLLGAGSKSGSVTAMSGTSFSTGLATRAVALELLDWLDPPLPNPGPAPDPKPIPGTEEWFTELAKRDEGPPDDRRFPGQVVKEKAGAGRILSPPTGRIAR